MRIAAAHNEDTHRRLAIYSVVDSLQPMIEPALLEGEKINRRIRAELGLARIAARATSMCPRSHNEALQALFIFRQRNKVHVGDLCAP